MNKVVVTGSTGFLGRSLINYLQIKNFEVTSILRGIKEDTLNEIYITGIDSRTEWKDKLSSTDIVVHCAARVHFMNEIVVDPLEDFREVNVRGTLQLADAAAKSGVKRFIFISSIKVNGESTTDKSPYLFSDTQAPEDPYAVSKAEAEKKLLELGKTTGMEIVIIRPPLVYGPGVKANFASLCKLVSKGFPLPFGLIKHNKRSMVYVGNLISLIEECMVNDKAKNQIFLVSDNQDLSLADFIKLLSVSMGKTTLLIPFPAFLFKLAGKLTKKSAVVDRLIGSLQVDISHTCKTLNWIPPYTVSDGFKVTVKDFQK